MGSETLINETLLKYPVVGKTAQGNNSIITKSEIPIRIDEVSTTLFYLGWAVFGASEDEYVWKIRKVSQIDTVWKQEYVNGSELFNSRWSDRTILNYK